MPSPTRTRRSDGERTHEAILDAAARLASVEGVRGLSIGRLAEATGVSKSGLFAHFGSKERLQLETIEAATAIFAREVMDPAYAAPAGRPRLDALFASFFSYVERRVFPGGCFFAGLLADEDARSGPVHDAAEQIERAWVDGFVGMVREAQELRHLGPDVGAEQLAFELYAYLELTNYHFVLFGDPVILERGRVAVADRLARAST
ncbi:MAG TPA: TetR/AcrR family transcriptional regulator [Actinomycetota bacterium]|nr:TetR/AcrR family transcriptional regulator [Actinomycetota bacterium]